MKNTMYLAAIIILTSHVASARGEAGDLLSTSIISSSDAQLQGELDHSDWFGFSLANLGDIDGDGDVEIAVGAPQDDDGGGSRGAVYLLSLTSGGDYSVKRKFSATQGGFLGNLEDGIQFGYSVAPAGDIDGNGTADLLVGVPFDSVLADLSGAVWILFLDTICSILNIRKISGLQGGLNDPLGERFYFGAAVSAYPDDTAGNPRIAVGGEGGPGETGEVWILTLDAAGFVQHEQKLVDGGAVMSSLLSPGDRFGTALTLLDDIDQDGVRDLGVGAPTTDGPGLDRGAAWILLMNPDATVKSPVLIDSSNPAFQGAVADTDRLGSSVAGAGDLDGDGVPDLVVGSENSSFGGVGGGTVGLLWSILLNEDGTARSAVSYGKSSGIPALSNGDRFGRSAARVADITGDGLHEVLAGAHSEEGVIWVLSLDASPWQFLVGTALAGETGDPVLQGSVGALIPASTTTLTISNAKTFSTAYMVVGFSTAFAPFKGGTMVPSVEVVLPIVTLAGTVALSLEWPLGVPPGITLAAQCWINDPAAPVGFSASNAILVLTP